MGSAEGQQPRLLSPRHFKLWNVVVGQLFETLQKQGINLEQIPNDGSPEWSDLRERAMQGAVHTSERLL